MYIYIHTHTYRGRYSQQGHFNDQMNEVGQQLLEEVLAACFCMRGRGGGGYYQRRMWQLPVDHSHYLSALRGAGAATSPSLSSIFYAECTEEWQRGWGGEVVWANWDCRSFSRVYDLMAESL